VVSLVSKLEQKKKVCSLGLTRNDMSGEDRILLLVVSEFVVSCLLLPTE
jgi:hypothetical protein